MSKELLSLIECPKLKLSVEVDRGLGESQMAGVYLIYQPELLGVTSRVSTVVYKPQRKSKCAVVN